jgi:hypothetical protein
MHLNWTDYTDTGSIITRNDLFAKSALYPNLIDRRVEYAVNTSIYIHLYIQ